MYAVKIRINGRIVKRTYNDEVKVDSRHETREAAEEAVRKIYNDFIGDGAKPEGTDTDFTVSVDNPDGGLVATERIYVEEE